MLCVLTTGMLPHHTIAHSWDGGGALVPKCVGGCTLTKTEALTLLSPAGGAPLAAET